MRLCELSLVLMVVLCRISSLNGKRSNKILNSIGAPGCAQKKVNKVQGCGERGKGSCSGIDTERQLLNELLSKSNYESLIRPVERHKQNVSVHFSLALNQLINLEDSTGQLESRVTLRMWWKDLRLRWEPDSYGGITKLHIPIKKLWIPDIDLYNGVDNSMKRDIRATVFHTGAVLWLPTATYQSTCAHEFRSNSWHCPLLFRSWTYSGEELDLKPFQGQSHIDLEELMPNPSWTVINGEGARVDKSYTCCSEQPIPTMEYLLDIRGNIGTLRLGRRKRTIRYSNEY